VTFWLIETEDHGMNIAKEALYILGHVKCGHRSSAGVGSETFRIEEYTEYTRIPHILLLFLSPLVGQGSRKQRWNREILVPPVNALGLKSDWHYVDGIVRQKVFCLVLTTFHSHYARAFCFCNKGHGDSNPGTATN
jgi:cell division inhibitor SulA